MSWVVGTKHHLGIVPDPENSQPHSADVSVVQLIDRVTYQNYMHMLYSTTCYIAVIISNLQQEMYHHSSPYLVALPHSPRREDNTCTSKQRQTHLRQGDKETHGLAQLGATN